MCTVHYQKTNRRGKVNPQITQITLMQINLRNLWIQAVKLFVVVGFTQSKVRQFTERRHASARF